MSDKDAIRQIAHDIRLLTVVVLFIVVSNAIGGCLNSEIAAALYQEMTGKDAVRVTGGAAELRGTLD